ncbi:hypothetical protein KXV85_001915, partial [Aspergillus fumigatus]
HRRGSGLHRRPAEAVHPHPDRSGQARRQGPVDGGRAQPDRDHHGRQPQGQYRRREARLYHLCQRPIDPVQGLERRHHRLPQRLAGHDRRRCPDRRRAGERPYRRLVPGHAGRDHRHPAPAWRQRHRRRQPDPCRDPQGPARHSGRRQPDHRLGPHRHHPCLRPRRPVHAGPERGAGHARGAAVPALAAGDADRRRGAAAVADHQLRHHVFRRLQPRQSVADGAHHRNRL